MNEQHAPLSQENPLVQSPSMAPTEVSPAPSEPPIVLKCSIPMPDAVLLLVVGLCLTLFGASLLPYGEGGLFLGWIFLGCGAIGIIYSLCTGGIKKFIAYFDARWAMRDKRYSTQAYVGAVVGTIMCLYVPLMIPILATACASFAVRNAKKLDIVTAEQSTKTKNIWNN